MTGTKEAPETKSRARAKTDVASIAESKQRHIGVNCPYKWTNSIHEGEDQGSSWEGEPEGEKAEELDGLQAPADERVLLAQKEQNHQMEKANGPKTSISLPC